MATNPAAPTPAPHARELLRSPVSLALWLTEGKPESVVAGGAGVFMNDDDGWVTRTLHPLVPQANHGFAGYHDVDLYVQVRDFHALHAKVTSLRNSTDVEWDRDVVHGYGGIGVPPVEPTSAVPVRVLDGYVRSCALVPPPHGGPRACACELGSAHSLRARMCVYTLRYSKLGLGQPKDGTIQVIFCNDAQEHPVEVFQLIAQFDLSPCAVLLQPSPPPVGCCWDPTRHFRIRLSSGAAWAALKRTCSIQPQLLCHHLAMKLSHLLDTSLDDDEGECTGKRFMEAMVADTYDTAYGTAYDTARLAEKAKVLWQTLLRVGKYESRGFTYVAAGPVPWRARPQNLSLDRHQAKAAMHTRARTTWNILLTLVVPAVRWLQRARFAIDVRRAMIVRLATRSVKDAAAAAEEEMEEEVGTHAHPASAMQEATAATAALRLTPSDEEHYDDAADDAPSFSSDGSEQATEDGDSERSVEMQRCDVA